VGAREFTLKRFGFPTRAVENPVTDELGTSAKPVLKNNPDRVFWLIINLGANVGYVALSGDVSSSKGVRLDTYGGWASMSAEEDGEAVAYEVHGVAPTGTSAIYVLEMEKSG